MMLYTTVCDGGCGERNTITSDDLPPGVNVPIPDGWTEVTLSTPAPALPTVIDDTSDRVKRAAKKAELPKEATAVMDAYLEGMSPMFATGPREVRQSFMYCPTCSLKVQLPKLDIPMPK